MSKRERMVRSLADAIMRIQGLGMVAAQAAAERAVSEAEGTAEGTTVSAISEIAPRRQRRTPRAP